MIFYRTFSNKMDVRSLNFEFCGSEWKANASAAYCSSKWRDSSCRPVSVCRPHWTRLESTARWRDAVFEERRKTLP